MPDDRPMIADFIGIADKAPQASRRGFMTASAALAAWADGDWEAGPHYAGTSAALVRAIEPVADILMRTETEAEKALRQALPA